MMTDKDLETDFWERAAIEALAGLIKVPEIGCEEAAEMAVMCADRLTAAWKERRGK